jgi:hypothetical protein
VSSWVAGEGVLISKGENGSTGGSSAGAREMEIEGTDRPERAIDVRRIEGCSWVGKEAASTRVITAQEEMRTLLTPTCDNKGGSQGRKEGHVGHTVTLSRFAPSVGFRPCFAWRPSLLYFLS